MPIIDQTKCTSCGLCARVCPMGVLQYNEGTAAVHPARRCMACWHCAAICPTHAIVEENLELYPPAPDSRLAQLVSMRRSARHFKSVPPEKSVIHTALARAAWAPSAKNLQDYSWTVLYGREKIDRLLQTILQWAPSSEDFRALPRLLKGGRDPITCGCTCIIFGHSGHCGNFSQADTVIAAATAELLLFEQGVGTCWGGFLTAAVNACPEAKVLLHIPAERTVYAILLAGIPDREPYINVPYRTIPEIHWE